MIRRQTIFILGAGASCHLDFPLGSELRQLILSNTVDHAALGVVSEDLNQFRSEFRRSGQVSIDNFLQLRPEFANIGKRMIAYILMPFENPDRLTSHVVARTRFQYSWYEYLFTCLRTTSYDDFWANAVRFITFNYDRSLEAYLSHCLQGSYSRPAEEVEERLDEWFVHVHGSLGSLGGVGSRPYDKSFSAVTVSEVAERLRIVHDVGHDDDGQKRAIEWIRCSEDQRILFLGFGYDRSNLRKLDWRQRQGTGTSFGLQPQERRVIQDVHRITCPPHGHESIIAFLRTELAREAMTD